MCLFVNNLGTKMNKPMIKTFAAVSIITVSTMLSGCFDTSSSTTATDTTTTAAAEGTAAYVKENLELKGDFSEDVTLEAGKTYKITGKVNFKSGTTLTIPAGTKLYGTTGSSYLAINAGAKIMAQGTQADPIIFTSAADIAGTSSADAQGEWGGLVLIGKAPIVGGTKVYEAGDQVGGGSDAGDNSGVLEYVAIKHTGYEVEKDKELNGLSLLAVGNGTTIKNIAIIGSADDGLEAWGGTVNLDHIFIYNAADDSFDTDLGYTGIISNSYGKQKIVDKDNYNSSGFETGNDKDSYTSKGGNSNPIAEQSTMPTYKNVTVEAVGGGIYLKNDAGGIYQNVSITLNNTTNTSGAIIMHRTTDTVDDLSGSPYGVQVMSPGIELINSQNASLIYSTQTAKGVNDGGSIDANAIKNYWQGTPNASLIYTSDNAGVTGATISDIWKGKAGTNDQ